jgi:hypothetical protein
MTFDDIEDVLRRGLATGLTVLVILAAPAAAAGLTVAAPAGGGPVQSLGSADPQRAERDDLARTAGAESSAAVQHDWGAPNRVDHFTDGLGEDWNVYEGEGHAGNGRRSPDAVEVEDGVLTITGNSRGTTAGLSWNPGQKYGRWEGRVRAPASAPSYHALMLLWPDAENFPVGGEIDFMEMLDADRQTTNLFLHYGRNNSQIGDEVEVDATEWHNWAVEWTPEAITAYLDGEPWFHTTDTAKFPPGPMHLAVQLDWFPQDGRTRTSTMEVDWVKQYPYDEDAQDTGGQKNTDDHDGGADDDHTDEHHDEHDSDDEPHDRPTR